MIDEDNKKSDNPGKNELKHSGNIGPQLQFIGNICEKIHQKKGYD